MSTARTAAQLGSRRHASMNAGLSMIHVTGWLDSTPAYAESAHRYLAQMMLSLGPSTVRCIERDLRSQRP